VTVEFFLDKVCKVGSLWWLPMFFWVSYFFWCHFLDYPADLEKNIRDNRVWPYLPMYWKDNKKRFIRTVSLFLFWGGNLFSACVLYYLFPQKHFSLLIIGMVLSVFIENKIRYFGTREIIRLQRDIYFQNYTQLANRAVSKGDEISDSELLAKTRWQHHNDLRLADKQGKLLPFLRGEAKL
jgi:hypothetical protein